MEIPTVQVDLFSSSTSSFKIAIQNAMFTWEKGGPFYPDSLLNKLTTKKTFSKTCLQTLIIQLVFFSYEMRLLEVAKCLAAVFVQVMP